METFVFLSYVVSSKGIKVDEKGGEGYEGVTYTPNQLHKLKVFIVWLVFITVLLRNLAHLLYHSLKLLKILLVLNGIKNRKIPSIWLKKS